DKMRSTRSAEPSFEPLGRPDYRPSIRSGDTESNFRSLTAGWCGYCCATGNFRVRSSVWDVPSILGQTPSRRNVPKYSNFWKKRNIEMFSNFFKTEVIWSFCKEKDKCRRLLSWRSRVAFAESRLGLLAGPDQ